MGKIIKIFFLLLFLFFVGAAGLIYYFMLEGTPPEIKIISLPQAIGKEGSLKIQATDERTGLSELAVEIIQEDLKKEYREKFPKTHWLFGSGVKDFSHTITIKPREAGLKDGKAMLRIIARDSSLWNSLKGNEKVIEQEIIIDTAAPRISLKIGTQYLNSGGAGLVTYTLNENAVKTGVWLDDIYFPSVNHNGTYLSLIAVPFDKKKIDKIQVEAIDIAGNSSFSGIPFRLKYKAPKLDKINISDSFLQQKMPIFLEFFPGFNGSNIELFIMINTELRKKNNEQIIKISQNITPDILWNKNFISLPNGAFRAGFPDERYYYYNGNKISRSNHMGVDLASLANAQVPAANSGIVAFADFLGIYGNTVMIDHGLGLFSLYSHLSQINVEKGDKVNGGDTIGNTGTTGLAGGDHLHYAMLINGVFVTPIEWWDKKWINDHIIANIK